MPRVSSASEDAFHFKGSFADGWGKTIDAKSVVFQYPPDKETGVQNPAGLFCELTIQRYKDGEGTKDSVPPETKLLSIQRASRDSGQLDLVHPGKYPDGNLDADPEDMTGELGAEGDTVFATQDGYQFNDKTGWMRFARSLEEKGFKPAVLKRTYFPDLVGLYAYFTTVTEKKFRDDMTGDPTVFLVKEIKEFPYEKATAKAGAPAKKAASKPASTPTAAPATAKAAAAIASAASNGADGSVTVEEIATAILRDTLAPAQKGAVMADIKKLKVNAFMAINKHKPAVEPSLKKAVQEQLGNEEWLEATGAMEGLFTVGVDGKVEFAS